MSRSDDYNGGIPVMSTPRRTGAVPKFASPALQLGQSSTLSDSYESLIGSIIQHKSMQSNILLFSMHLYYLHVAFAIKVLLYLSE